MSYSLLTTPPNYLSAHGDIIFVAFENVKAIDPATYQDYKYVCDIYVNSVQIARLKSFPDPVNNFGIFNIGDIVRAYVATTFNPAAGIRTQELGEGEFFVSIVCEFGEEYNFVTYTNLVTDSTRKYYNHYNGRLIGQNTILSNYADKAATNRSFYNKVQNTSPAFIPYLPTSTSTYDVVIKSYDFSNTNVGTQTATFTPAAAYELQILNVSPAAINGVYTGFIDDNIKYYTVKIGSTSTYQFTLDCVPKYTLYSLVWMNQLGGFESFDFSYVSRKTINIEKHDFTKIPYVIDASGNVSYYNSNNVYNELKSVFSSQFTEKLRLTSDFVNDTQYVWLKELVTSPMVFIIINSYYVPVAITDVDYEMKQAQNDNLTSLILNVQYGQTYNTQYR